LIDKTVALLPELSGIEAGQGVSNVEEIIAIDEEVHSDCGLAIAKCGIDIRKSEIRIPNSEIGGIRDNPATPDSSGFSL
jgi:hypothetical protein